MEYHCLEKEYVTSINIFKQGIEYVFDNSVLLNEFYNSLAECYNETKDYESSDSLFELSLKINPSNPTVLNNYSYYLSLRGVDLEKAKEMSFNSNLLEPNNGTFQDTYAWILYKLQQYDEALSWIVKAVENGSGESPVVLEHYGDILYMLNRKNEAFEKWEQAKAFGKGSELLEKKIREKKNYMSKLKYLLFFFLTSCSPPYLTNTNVNESQNSDLQIKNSFKASGEFTYYEQSPPMNGKINLILDYNDNFWVSVNSLFNLELFRVVLISDTLYLINRIEKNYQKISINESINIFNENLLEKIKNFENTKLEFKGTTFHLFFSEFNDVTVSKLPKNIILKKEDKEEVFLEINLNKAQRTNQKVEINIPDSYEKI